MKCLYLSVFLFLSAAASCFAQYTAKQLYDEYQKNPVSFDDKYFNKTLTITGKIRSIYPNNYFMKGMDNSHTVNLTATNYENFVICKVPYEDKDKLTPLVVGKDVSVTGTYSRKIQGSVVLTDVQFTTAQVHTEPVKVNKLPAALPVGYYKCYVDHTTNLAMAGYFTVQPNNKYIFHGFDPDKRTGTQGSFRYDAATGKITWLSGAWKTNKYYGLYSLDEVYGNRIYLIPIGSDYSACKCFIQ